MTGKNRLIRTGQTKLATAIATALLITPIADAKSRKPAPIKYAGQGSYKASTSSYNPVQSGASSDRYTGRSYKSQRSTAPSYSRPVVASTDNAKTKRIEFRYPDQPNIVHGSDGSTQSASDTRPIKYSSHKSAVATHEARKHASVGTPTPIFSPVSKSPVLDQPNYSRSAIEETVLVDAVVPATREKIAPEQGTLPFKPVAQPGFEGRGIASWYGDEFHGQPTANGEIFDMTALTAAHPTLPLPSLVQVTNLANNREIVVRVNDRGPFVANRMIDLSKRAADELGFLVDGDAEVQIRYLGPAPLATAQNTLGQGDAHVKVAQALSLQATETQPQANYPQLKMAPIPNPIEDNYFIQAGSFAQMENAERLSAELGGSLPVSVVLANVRGADFFRVLVGPYGSRGDASAMRDQLDASGIVDGVIVRND